MTTGYFKIYNMTKDPKIRLLVQSSLLKCGADKKPLNSEEEILFAVA